MTTALMPEARQRYYNNDGSLAAGCYLYTYASGTTTPKAAYQDSAGATPHANPIVLDSKGEALIYWNGSYKVDLKTAAGVQITGYPVDNYKTDPAGVWGLQATILALLAAAGGSDLIGYQNSILSGAVLGSLYDRVYDVNLVADFGADPTGVADATTALNAFFNALSANPNQNALIPPGTYKYTPVIGSGTGIGYLNLVNATNIKIFGYGATIKQNAAVTTAQNTANTRYGIKVEGCTDCEFHGLAFNGNRDTTYGTNGDGNEFYSGFWMRGCTRTHLIYCSAYNCQGDGVSRDRSGVTTGFNYYCNIIGGYYGINRRNEISIGGDFGSFIGGGITLVGGADHRTSPAAGLDLEWEHATIGPSGDDTQTIIDGVNCSGTMSGGALYIPCYSGVMIDHLVTSSVVTSVNIANTRTGNYETQNINFGSGNQFNTQYGISITGGANIHGSGFKLQCTYPLIVNSPMAAAPYGWVADFSNLHIEGESVYAVKVLAGKTKFNNNMCVNCSSSGGNYFLGLFIPQCEVKGNTFTRDTNQTQPGYGLVFANVLSVVLGNSIVSGAAITHPISYGHASTACYPPMQNNFYNGAALPDTVATKQFASPLIDMASAAPQVMYTPFFGDNSEITSLLAAVAVAGTNVISTTSMKIGIVSDDDKYLAPYTVNLWDLGDVTDLAGSMASLNTTYALPIFVTPTPGNNLPKLQFIATLRTNRAGLYTSAVTFS